MRKKMKILVADDERIIRNLFVDLFVDLGYQAVAVNNGLEAVNKVRNEDFTLAFIDVHMPMLNGLEVLREIKKIRPKIKVVMMDSYPDPLVEQAQREGSVTCIHKPFEIKLVLAIIDQVKQGRDEVCVKDTS